MNDIEQLRLWIRVMAVIASLATTSFPILYSFYPWRQRAIGRVLMGVGVSFAITLDMSTLMSFWRPKNILIIFWMDAVVLTMIAVSTSSLTYVMWRINRPNRMRFNIMQFSGKAYDILKKVALIYLPGLGALYFALAQIWHLPNPEDVVGTIVAIDTFLGGALHLSNQSYQNDPNRTAGTLELIPGEDGTNLRISSLDSQQLLTKPEVTFKMAGTPTQ